MKNNTKDNKFYLHVIRFIAIFLVIYCHFISVGSGWLRIPGVIDPSAKKPLLRANSLTYFDTFLKNHFSTCAGTLGVCLFFLMSGFLIPNMMERHTRSTFFVNRIVRIFPVMWICLFISGFVTYWTNGISFSVGEYLLNMFLIKTTIGGGMRWMLPTLVIFYFIATIIGKFNFKKVLISVLSIMLFMAYVIYVVFGGSYDSVNEPPILLHRILYHICFILQFIPIVFIGTSIYLSEQYKSILAKIACVSFFTALAYLSLRLSSRVGYFSCEDDMSTYGNLGTYLIVLGLWYAVYFIFEKGKIKLGSKIKLVSILKNIIQRVSEAGYPIYLLHLSIGLTLIEKIRYVCTNSYIILGVVLVFVLVVSRLVYLRVEVPIILLGKKLNAYIKSRKK